MSSITITGILHVGPYKGYQGRAKYDAEAKIFHGEVTETNDVITFAGKTPAETAKAFSESVDDYLDFCASSGESPDKAYSGKFLVRVSPKLHRELAVAASLIGKSLNHYVSSILQLASSAMTIGPHTHTFQMDLPSIVFGAQDSAARIPSTLSSRPLPVQPMQPERFYGGGGIMSVLPPVRKQAAQKVG